MIWKPTGSPSDSPHGTEMAGTPARLAGSVHRSAAYMAIGSSTRAPSGKATVGVVGLTSTSTPWSSAVPKAAEKSRLISVRTFCACP